MTVKSRETRLFHPGLSQVLTHSCQSGKAPSSITSTRGATSVGLPTARFSLSRLPGCSYTKRRPSSLLEPEVLARLAAHTMLDVWWWRAMEYPGAAAGPDVADGAFMLGYD